MVAPRALAAELWQRRQSPVVGASGLAVVFVVAWVIKDLLAGTSLVHAVVAGILLGAVAGVVYWVALRAMQAVGHSDES